MSEGEIVAWTTAVTAVVGGLGGGLAAWLKNRKQDRADALIEYQRLVHDLREEVTALQEKMETLQQDHTKCQVENAKLGGQIQLLQAAMQRLQQAVGDKSPPVTTPVLITCKPDGTIIDVTSNVSALFHYLPGELMARNVEILIPDRYREKHRSGLLKIVQNGWDRWEDQAIVAFATTRSNEEVPVTISLNAWQNEQDEWFITAQIYSRQEIQTKSAIHRKLVDNLEKSRGKQ